MRRFLAPLAVTFVLATVIPAQAVEPSGSVVLPIFTPTPAREAYNAGLETNLLAVYISLPPAADGQSYTLTRTSGFGNLDAYFYTNGPGGSIGSICSPIVSSDGDPINPSTEVGTICPGSQTAAWAVIILRWGANAGFTFAY